MDKTAILLGSMTHEIGQMFRFCSQGKIGLPSDLQRCPDGIRYERPKDVRGECEMVEALVLSLLTTTRVVLPLMFLLAVGTVARRYSEKT